MRYSLKARLARLWNDEGGWIQAALFGAGALGNLFSKGAQSAAEGRKSEAELLLQRDQLRNQQFNTEQNAQFNAGQLDLQRKQFGENARSNRARQAAVADILRNFQPTQINVPGITPAKISGGLQVTPGARAALGNLYQQALAAQLQGDTFTGGELLKAPELSKLPEAGKWERLAGILGTIGNIAGAVGSIRGGAGDGGGAGAVGGGGTPNFFNPQNVRF